MALLSVGATWSIARRSESTASRRAAAEHLRTERLLAYSAFLGTARAAHRAGWTAMGSRSGEPAADSELGEPRPDLSPGGANVALSDLAAPIRLLRPELNDLARDVIVAVTLFLDDVSNGNLREARKEEPQDEINRFEAAAAADLAAPVVRKKRGAR